MRELRASHSLWRDRINYVQLFLQSIRICKASVFALSKHSSASFLAERAEHTGHICRDTPTPYREACAVRVTLDEAQTLAFISLPRGNSAMQKNPIKSDNMLELIANDSVWWRQVKNKPCNKFMSSYLGGKAILKHTNQPSAVTWRLCQHTFPQ